MDTDSTVDLLKEIMGGWDGTLDEQKENRQSRNRKLAGDDMAQRIMDTLCENGQGDFLLLRDDEIREWWQSVLADRRRAQQRLAAARRRDALRESGLNKLTAEERKALGLGG